MGPSLPTITQKVRRAALVPCFVATGNKHSETYVRNLFIFYTWYSLLILRISVICCENGPTRSTNANECGSGRAFRIGEYSSIMTILS